MTKYMTLRGDPINNRTANLRHINTVVAENNSQKFYIKRQKAYWIQPAHSCLITHRSRGPAQTPIADEATYRDTLPNERKGPDLITFGTFLEDFPEIMNHTAPHMKFAVFVQMRDQATRTPGQSETARPERR